MGKKQFDSKPSSSNHPITVAAATPLANISLKSVLLHDWWVSKAQPKGLAIGGRRLGEREFFSAPISKRHDATTLETEDGITIAISGLMNRSLALNNGFPPELCSLFFYGFPYDWEEYSNMESAGRGTQTNFTGAVGVESSSYTNATSFLPSSLSNLPATTIRDLLILSAGDSHKSSLGTSIFDHVVEKLNNHASQSKAGNSISTATPGVTTRSMSRLKYHRRNLSSEDSVKETVEVSSPEAKESYHGENQGNKQAKNIATNIFTSPESNPNLSPKAKDSHRGENQGNKQAKNIATKLFTLSESTPNLSPEAKDSHPGENQGNKQAENISGKSFFLHESNSNRAPEPKESQCEECKGNKQAKNISAKQFIAPESISSSEPSTRRQMVTRSSLRGSRATTLSRQKVDVPPSAPGAIGNLSKESVEDRQALSLTPKSMNIQGINKTSCRRAQLSTSKPSKKKARILETRSSVRRTRSRTLNYQGS